MSNAVYDPLIGVVQQFPNKPVMQDVDSGKGAKRFTIKAYPGGQVVSVTVFDDVDWVGAVGKGDWVLMDGKKQKNGDYNNYTAQSVRVIGGSTLTGDF